MRAANDATDTLRFTITVVEPPRFDPEVIEQTYTISAPIRSLQLPTAGGGHGDLSYALTQELPPGLDFDTDTHTISGTPTRTTRAGTAFYTVTDENGASSSGSFRVTVAAALNFATTIADQIYTSGRPISMMLPEVMGGTGPLIYLLSGDAVPGWLHFDLASLTLSGTPLAAAAAIPLSWTVRDANDATDTLRFTITVVEPPRFDPEVIEQTLYHQRDYRAPATAAGRGWRAAASLRTARSPAARAWL
ncbi:putative Ig domain-containing protein [Candidatus Spongiihabitans sp.]|uniref:putative Ig domain-containing protein n=1 Tax=Candidatus Spongiihabitans sp. TaxID=3101308 RepID=UPI003C7ED3CD